MWINCGQKASVDKLWTNILRRGKVDKWWTNFRQRGICPQFAHHYNCGDVGGWALHIACMSYRTDWYRLYM